MVLGGKEEIPIVSGGKVEILKSDAGRT